MVPDFFTYIFINPDSAILSMSAPAIRIYFVGFMMLGINMVFICYFQAILKNGYSMIICLMRGLILVVAFAYIFPLFMDVTGIWLAVPAAETITMLFGIYLIYFKKSAKREINDKSL